MTLHDVDVYKYIHESECSFLVAVVHETHTCLHYPSLPPKLFFPQLCDGRSDVGGARG